VSYASTNNLEPGINHQAPALICLSLPSVCSRLVSLQNTLPPGVKPSDVNVSEFLSDLLATRPLAVYFKIMPNRVIGSSRNRLPTFFELQRGLFMQMPLYILQPHTKTSVPLFWSATHRTAHHRDDNNHLKNDGLCNPCLRCFIRAP
jgi:hypothetical protein